MILAAIIEGRRDKLSQFSPEQQKALRMQNHAFGLWVIVFLTGSCVCSLFSQVTFVQNAGQWLNVLIFLFGGGVMAFIALSSIFSEASILSGRHRRDYLKGQEAVWTGIAVLFVLGLALYAWLSSLGN